jgi:glycosyltransferase involved in cell wall biosynthesis
VSREPRRSSTWTGERRSRGGALRISESTFVIAVNGFADGPAQALRDYLLRNEARALTVVAHPLDPRDGHRHLINTFESGRLVREKAIALPSRPPFTYPLDLAVPLRAPRCDAWFGFNNLACLRGLAERKLGRARKVYYWAVDFVPDRFGTGVLTRSYDQLDGLASRRADGRIELSEAALRGRAERLELSDHAAPALVAPMGAWLDQIPKVTSDAWERRKVVYVGHLVERQGVSTLLKALAILDSRGAGVTADIIGSGPLEHDLRLESRALGLGDRVTFHGFVEDHREVERILASGAVAAAPYVVSDDNFTRFADPGKLKAYLAAGLPVVLTSVPPNAVEIAEVGAGRVVSDSADAIADGIDDLLTTKDGWITASHHASAYAEQFDWSRVFERALAELGIGVLDP